jgi:co-chaperonin GroES (HSP10)
MKIQPLNEMVLVQPELGPSMTDGGLHLPPSAIKQREWGLVKASDFPGVSEGQTVLYSPHGAAEVVVDGDKMFLVPKTQILGIVTL